MDGANHMGLRSAHGGTCCDSVNELSDPRVFYSRKAFDLVAMRVQENGGNEGEANETRSGFAMRTLPRRHVVRNCSIPRPHLTPFIESSFIHTHRTIECSSLFEVTLIPESTLRTRGLRNSIRLGLADQ